MDTVERRRHGMTLDLNAEVLQRGSVQAHEADHALHVTLDRPEARNAQTPAMWKALAEIGAAVDSSARPPTLVVIRGAGAAFSAGLDRRMFTLEGIPGEASLAALGGMADDELHRAISGFQEGFRWQRRVPSLTVAAVHGHAIGAGFQLALACDVLLATPDSSFAMRETSYGLVPDLCGTHPLVRSVGYARAVELCATGRAISGDEGYAMGFVTRVTSDLDSAVAEMAATVGAAPSGAIAALKPLLSGADDRTLADQAKAERHAQIARLRSLLSGA
jgi:enoyl-CoA hydratase/carnithine racemase